MITHPELPIAQIRIAGAGDEEGEKSEDLGLMNGHIEDMLRIAVRMDRKGSRYNWLGEDCEVSLALYSLDNAVRDIASRLPGKDVEARLLPEKYKSPDLIKYVSPQEEIRKKVAFIVYNREEDKYIKALNPETKFTTIPLSWAPDRETVIAVEV